MLAWCKQISENFAANTEQNLGNTLVALLDHTWYSTLNNNITAKLPRCYSIMDCESVIVSSNHTAILSIISSTKIRHSLGNWQKKNHFGGSKVKKFPCIKSTGPDDTLYQKHKTWSFFFSKLRILELLTDSAFYMHLPLILQFVIFNLISKCKSVLSNPNVIKITSLLSRISKYPKSLIEKFDLGQWISLLYFVG